MLQDYYYPDKGASFYRIPWESADGNKLVLVRTFHAVLRFLLREYNRLLCQVDDQLEGQSSGITSQLQTREFLNSSSCDNRQFPAYLCSQGYRPLLYCQETGHATEVILSLHRQYRQLRQTRRTCPLVVVAHLKDPVEALFAGSQTMRDFWTSGAFMFDDERLYQLDERWGFVTFDFLEDALYGAVDEYGNLS